MYQFSSIRAPNLTNEKYLCLNASTMIGQEAQSLLVKLLILISRRCVRKLVVLDQTTNAMISGTVHNLTTPKFLIVHETSFRLNSSLKAKPTRVKLHPCLKNKTDFKTNVRVPTNPDTSK